MFLKELLKLTPIAILACCLLVSPRDIQGARGAAYKIGTITIGQPWARASILADRPSAAYMVISNSGPADTLLSASTPLAKKVQVHKSLMEKGVMKMIKISPLLIPAHGMVHLKPGGYHFMLIQLVKPLKAGDHLPLTLNFNNAGTISVQVMVRKITGSTQHNLKGHSN